MAPSESTMGGAPARNGAEATASPPSQSSDAALPIDGSRPGAARNLPFATIETAFAAHLGHRRWVLWSERPGKKDPTKLDKVPLIATGRRVGASSTESSTWRTWAVALQYLHVGAIAGPGIMLGKLEDDRWLVGIDLDLALSPITGAVEPWAQEVLERCPTYGEISPSGAGLKLFGYARELPTCLLTEDTKGRSYYKGTEGTPPGAAIPEGADSTGHKQPELGLYAERRYFTVTGRKLPSAPNELTDITDAFAGLVTMVGSWGATVSAPGTRDRTNAQLAQAVATVDMASAVGGLLALEPELAAAWQSGVKLTKGPDQSGSGLDYSLMIWLAGRGHDDATIEAALRGYPHGQFRRLDHGAATRRMRDLLREAGKRRDRAARAREAAAWLDDLICGKDGPLDNVANVCIALAGDPVFGDGIQFDELQACPVAGPVPWRACEGRREWTDTDDIALAEWLQLRGLNAKPATCAAAVQHFAAANTVHPLRELLDELVWDGQPRLDNWVVSYLGVNDSGYARAVGRLWMVQAVARIYSPGCKGDHALILEGPQGAFKSTACAILATSAEWFADEIADLGSKDSAQDLRGKWIIEIGELSALRRSEVERIKAFISRCVDHYRPSYGRRSQDFPRSCVFIGTTNADTYLADETGGRRFWPVKVTIVDVDGLRRDIGQLWAEAVAAFKAGEAWHLPREIETEARTQQSDRRISDPWEQAVISWASDKPGPVTVADALQYAIGLELERRTQGDENRVARIFKAHGWERVQLRVAGERIWHYRRPAQEPEPTAPQVETGRIATVYAMAGRRASPLSPVARGSSGDRNASNHAAVTSVTTVTSKLETVGRSAPSPHGAAVGSAGIAYDSAIESGNMLVTPVTLVTAAKPLKNSAPLCSGDSGHSGDTGNHAWDDLDHWRFRLGRAGASRDARTRAILDWGRAAGGTVATTGEQIRLTLPTDLADGYALRELRRLASDLGVINKVVFPRTATEACTTMPIRTRPADLPDNFGKNGGA